MRLIASADLSHPPLSLSHADAYCFTVHHRGVRETPCTEVSCGGKGEGRRGEGGNGDGVSRPMRHEGGSGGEYRSHACAVRSAISQAGRRLLRLASVVRDILSAIRFGVNVSSSGRHRIAHTRFSKLPSLEGAGGERKRLVTLHYEIIGIG